MNSPTLTVLSLGGGVQSSVMALMAGEGAALFSTTLLHCFHYGTSNTMASRS